MTETLIPYGAKSADEGALTLLGDDQLLKMAAVASRRVEAVKRIKATALAVTNERDWVNQDGNPYLMVSGAEKLAALFGIEWSFLRPEPILEEEADGHYTYTYQARFTCMQRTIEVEGSRSSRDGFFRQYTGYGDQKKEKPLDKRDNRRDVKMAALTNLIGNGITRILGIRNLTWDDLKEYAKIDPSKVKGFVYKKAEPKPEVRPPARASATARPAQAPQEAAQPPDPGPPDFWDQEPAAPPKAAPQVTQPPKGDKPPISKAQFDLLKNESEKAKMSAADLESVIYTHTGRTMNARDIPWNYFQAILDEVRARIPNQAEIPFA